MALGLNLESGSGDFLPIVKYDARAGRMFRIDRKDNVSTPEDITKDFMAVFDFENIEVGWIDFQTGGAPAFTLVPFGSNLPPQPGTAKQGVRFMLRLEKKCGGDVRELATTAKAALRGIDMLHNAYIEGEAANPGMLPVVVIKDTIAVVSEGSGQKTTNYQPIFEIVGWTARPTDLTFKPRNRPQPATNGATAAKFTTAPATGSTRVPAPAAIAAKAAKPAMAVVEGDFG